MTCQLLSSRRGVARTSLALAPTTSCVWRGVPDLMQVPHNHLHSDALRLHALCDAAAPLPHRRGDADGARDAGGAHDWRGESRAISGHLGPSRAILQAVLMIGAGCALSSYGEGHFHPVGVLFRRARCPEITRDYPRLPASSSRRGRLKEKKKQRAQGRDGAWSPHVAVQRFFSL